MLHEANQDSGANADPSELRKFAELASRWWDPQASMRPLHEINPLLCSNWIDGLAGLRGKRVVDVGCGGGILAEAMAKPVRRCSASTCRSSR